MLIDASFHLCMEEPIIIGTVIRDTKLRSAKQAQGLTDIASRAASVEKCQQAQAILDIKAFTSNGALSSTSPVKQSKPRFCSRRSSAKSSLQVI